MKIKFEFPGSRKIRNQFFWLTVYKNGQPLWWSEQDNIWLRKPIFDASSTKRCSSVKAFKRHIRKHAELKECTAILVSMFEGHDVICNV